MRSKTTEPIAIPTMAAVESFFDFLSDGINTGDGEGDDDGKNGVQGGNGAPHKSILPENEEAGNFDKLLGIDPLR